MLADLPRAKKFRTARQSSYDKTGGNADFIVVAPKSKATIFEHTGAGCIKHIWITIGAEEVFYLRKIVLRAFWDDEELPSIECPIGDFFGVGHGLVKHFVSLVLSMSAERGFNCYFPMPFERSAKIEVENEGELPINAFFYHIDYEIYDSLEPDLYRFHAQWRRENPTEATTAGAPNLTGKDNYVILEAEGEGHYVGCTINVDALSAGWWGEGDDMIFIDGEGFPPAIHGTGTEDYFGSAWGFPIKFFGPYHGCPLRGSEDWSGKWSAYRFHLQDPITFKKSIKVTIEHGHANDRSDDWSSVAYWYQKEPHKPFPKLPEVSLRLPRQ